ncbi:hypothetical protein LCGC14_0608690 [marine sediment metagenome]|uniref:Uncharacterized protein n=1 Tax=marine sediment metagenome TaxID=412755 RepID=A0A0F9R8K0_9ZZZZ
MAKRSEKQEGKELTDKEVLFSISRKIGNVLEKESPRSNFRCNLQDLPTIIEYLLLEIKSLKNEKKHLEILLEEKGY